VSPHYYTTDDELEAFLAELDQVRKLDINSMTTAAY